MRLREIKTILEQYENDISIESEKLNNGLYNIIGLQRSLNAINELSKFGFLDDDIERFKKLGSIYYDKTPDDKINVKEQTYRDMSHYISIAKEKVSGYSKTIGSAIPSNNDDLLSVKLPNYDRLKDLSGFFGDLDKAFRMALKNDTIKGEYKLQNFDSGSIWVDILLSVGTIQFIGQLIKTSYTVKQKSTELQITQRQLEMLGIQEELMKNAKEKIEEQMDTIVEADTKAIFEGEKYSEEAKNSIRQSIKTFSKLISEGTEFHTQLNAAEEVQESFPTPQQQIENTQKLLKEHLNNDEE